MPWIMILGASFKKNRNALFHKFKEDYENAATMDETSLEKLLSDDYQSFYSTSLVTGKRRKVSHYPTYYLGSFLFGSIDLAFSSEKVFLVLKNPSLFVPTFNEAMKKLGLWNKFSL